MRSGLLRAALALALVGGLFWPAVLTYTFLAGERATAQVAECHRTTSGRASQLNCTGTWRTDGGDVGSGGLNGLRRTDAGTSVEVRVGPLGPYGRGFAGSWHVFTVSLFWSLSFGGLVLSQHRARRRAAPLLAAPAALGDLLIVTGKGARTPDGRRHATVSPVPSPPMPRKARAKTSHWEVRGSAGQPLFRVDQRGGKSSGTEMVVRDPSGAPRHIIRMVGTGPGSHYALLHADGTFLGRIDTFAGAKWGAYEIRDDRGTVWARTVLRMPEWVLRMEPGAPHPFPYLALAFTIGQRRRPR
ncbi:hypothetical protein [Actinomadura sp. WMMB 499]|uniref:hypothetical protein n=1 Tax=Actinomadura sp. WMMB 499 TaxID=1219491 RepID=UPI001248EDF7|nr:hypothetical protein [Actinomadura sp. WMMB 499]QFG21720.1 hypothetical protein F7P10_11820 [Actinomadura sp. WMMB 499]